MSPDGFDQKEQKEKPSDRMPAIEQVHPKGG
jgi:hypothetical protein